MWRAWNGIGVTALNRWLISDQVDDIARREAVQAFLMSMRINPDQQKVAALLERYQLNG